MLTTSQRENLGYKEPERVKQAKRYDRSFKIEEPPTFSNRTYQNKSIDKPGCEYEKGTKKFWSKQNEILGGKSQ